MNFIFQKGIPFMSSLVFNHLDVLTTDKKDAAEKRHKENRQKIEAARTERLQKALRENLRKRKEQMRARVTPLDKNEI